MKPPALAAAPPQGDTHRAGRSHFRVRSCAVVMVFYYALSPACAQYSIPWWSIGSGGGKSTNGSFSITGAIGQSGVGAAQDFSRFSATGGFWALPVAVQVAGAPTLNIARTVPGFALVWWTPPSTNWVLQETVSLTGTWSNAPSGWTNPVTVSTLPPRKFYRLSSP